MRKQELADMVKSLSLTIPVREYLKENETWPEHPTRMVVLSLAIISEQLALLAAILAE